ncbi:MAG: NAD(P)H-hydrate dehydratase [Eubacteriales bacterium]|nr:NAD(P)H-hydrate dehydratase [Eubacteriales bacterium]
MLIATPTQMNNIDQRAVKKGVPSLLLMENAASAVVCELPPKAKSFLVVCGSGNNGGDGYAVARQLFCSGKMVEVLCVSPPKTDDAKLNYKYAKDIGVPFVTFDKLKEYDVIIDAMLGTGLSGDVRQEQKEIIEYINNTKSYIISVDVPSGTDGASGITCGISVKADKTVTFALIKQGQLWSDNVGKLVLKSISIPIDAINEENITTYLLEKSDVKQMLPQRSTDSHKGSCGKILVVAGSEGMTGAARLSCEAALRSGCGLVKLAIPRSLNIVMEKTLIEAMTIPVAEFDGAISQESVGEISSHLKNSDVLLIGCGLSTKPQTKRAFAEIIKQSNLPMVIDADGLNILSEDIHLIDGKNVVITPHLMEFSRLSGLTIEEINKDKVTVATMFATKYNVVLVLKGKGTVIALPDGRCYINNTGNEGMATGGSGDVLVGMIASFIGQGMTTQNAALCGVYLHGLSGDIAKEYKGIYSMLPTDMISYIGEAIDIVKEVE